MLNNLKINKIFWSITSALSLFAALTGVLNIGIYNKIVATNLIPGALSQDVMTVIVAFALAFLTFSIRENDVKKPIVVLGILGYLFYAYGIYVIERAYNMLYLVYILIFTLSFWGMVYGGINIKKDLLNKSIMPSDIRKISAIGSLIIPLIFIPLWVFMLIPLMKTGNQIDNLYSVFILDLCFIMPAFLIMSYQTFREKGIGYLLSPAMFILGFTLIFSLALGELVKPIFHLTPKIPDLIQSTVLSLLFLLLGVWHLAKLKINS